MKKIIPKDICEAEYYDNKKKLEDLLIITFISTFSVFFILMVLDIGIKNCLIGAAIFSGVPFSIKRMTGLSLTYSFSIFGIVWLLMRLVVIIIASDIITLFCFVHYACQTSYYKKHLKEYL